MKFIAQDRFSEEEKSMIIKKYRPNLFTTTVLYITYYMLHTAYKSALFFFAYTLAKPAIAKTVPLCRRVLVIKKKTVNVRVYNVLVESSRRTGEDE